MYERFTDRARKVMQLANQEAQRFNHTYIGPEHIVLGLLKEGTGVGINALKNLGIELRAVRLEVEKLIQQGTDTEVVTMGKLPQTASAHTVIQTAIKEAVKLQNNYAIGTEHILLGLVQVESVASQVLKQLHVSYDQLVLAVQELQGEGAEVCWSERLRALLVER